MSTAITQAEPEPSVDVKSMAVILRCSPDKVYRMARSKPPQIPYIRVGRALRFFPSEVIEKLRTPAASWEQSKRSTARRRRA